MAVLLTAAVELLLHHFYRLDPPPSQVLRATGQPLDARPYNIHYRVAAGLDGKSMAISAGGGAPAGRFTGKVSDAAPQAKVADSGKDIISGGESIEPRSPKN